MKSRAVIKKRDNWWYGWLVDIPGVNAQEKSEEELIKSLISGAEDMLKVNAEEAGKSEIKMIEIPEAQLAI